MLLVERHKCLPAYKKLCSILTFTLRVQRLLIAIVVEVVGVIILPDVIFILFDFLSAEVWFLLNS